MNAILDIFLECFEYFSCVQDKLRDFGAVQIPSSIVMGKKGRSRGRKPRFVDPSIAQAKSISKILR